MRLNLSMLMRYRSWNYSLCPVAPAGLVDYHGESVAVIDLSMWLGLNNSEAYHLNTPIVICGGGVPK